MSVLNKKSQGRSKFERVQGEKGSFVFAFRTDQYSRLTFLPFFQFKNYFCLLDLRPSICCLFIR
jgi:hypothetical protein